MQHKSKIKSLVMALGLATPLFFSNSANAEGRLTFYCTVQNNACEKVAKTFGEKYGVETAFIHGSTGTILGKLKAEKDNPQADFWYGGTLEPHLQAADLGLLESFRPENQANIHPQFKAINDKYGEYTSVIYALVMGLGVNTEKLQKLGVSAPKTWEDLLNPKWKDELQLPDPRSSGTTFTFMATLISLYGEEKAFEFLKKLDANISQYAKSNLVVANLTRGEIAGSITFAHALITEKEKGAPVEPIIPEGKVGYALGGASIIKGARNLDNAKLFANFVLSKEIQEMPWRDFGYYQIPSVTNAEVSPKSPDLSKLQLVEYDFEKFGSAEEGKRLINKWASEVKFAK